MKIIIWARVSSREQKEGYSIDAQLRATRDMAKKLGWIIVKEFVVAESAKRGSERRAFNEMLRWVKKNARKELINVILSHKLDRVCRNMRDAVRLQELEDDFHIQLAFVENQFGGGAAGTLSFNVMAAVAQYYSDNLRTEVLKGMDERVRQGWPTGLAPYGYMNCDDRQEPVKPHPVRGKTLQRIFELYSAGNLTMKALAEKLLTEGHRYQDKNPKFNMSSLSYIINNRFYIGELNRNGVVHEGKYQLLIDRATFKACQEVLNGKNHRLTSPELKYSGGLFQCAHCGASITGEKICRKLKDGGVREHIYYRCSNYRVIADHPKVRWREADLELAILKDLSTLHFDDADLAKWFRSALEAAFKDVVEAKSRRLAALHKRQGELVQMTDRLLNAHLTGVVDEATYLSKSNELKREDKDVEEALGQLNAEESPVDVDLGLKLFDFSQNVVELWLGSNISARREILDLICLNRTVSDVSLVLVKRKPFDAVSSIGKHSAKRPVLDKSRGDRIRTYDPLVPNQMR